MGLEEIVNRIKEFAERNNASLEIGKQNGSFYIQYEDEVPFVHLESFLKYGSGELKVLLLLDPSKFYVDRELARFVRDEMRKWGYDDIKFRKFLLTGALQETSRFLREGKGARRYLSNIIKGIRAYVISKIGEKNRNGEFNGICYDFANYICKILLEKGYLALPVQVKTKSLPEYLSHYLVLVFTDKGYTLLNTITQNRISEVFPSLTPALAKKLGIKIPIINGDWEVIPGHLEIKHIILNVDGFDALVTIVGACHGVPAFYNPNFAILRALIEYIKPSYLLFEGSPCFPDPKPEMFIGDENIPDFLRIIGDIKVGKLDPIIGVNGVPYLALDVSIIDKSLGWNLRRRIVSEFLVEYALLVPALAGAFYLIPLTGLLPLDFLLRIGTATLAVLLWERKRPKSIRELERRIYRCLAKRGMRKRVPKAYHNYREVGMSFGIKRIIEEAIKRGESRRILVMVGEAHLLPIIEWLNDEELVDYARIASDFSVQRGVYLSFVYTPLLNIGVIVPYFIREN